MTLVERIQKDIVTSMKEKDSFTLNVVRMVKGAIQLEAISKKKELTDDEVIGVVSKQIKMRNDSIAEFEKGGREDLVEQNKKEIEIDRKQIDLKDGLSSLGYHDVNIELYKDVIGVIKVKLEK